METILPSGSSHSASDFASSVLPQFQLNGKQISSTRFIIVHHGSYMTPAEVKLPTPVGPKNRHEAIGLFGSASPYRDRWILSVWIKNYLGGERVKVGFQLLQLLMVQRIQVTPGPKHEQHRPDQSSACAVPPDTTPAVSQTDLTHPTIPNRIISSNISLRTPWNTANILNALGNTPQQILTASSLVHQHSLSSRFKRRWRSPIDIFSTGIP